MLSKDEVIKIAKLARIKLSDAEVEKFQKELSTILEYLNELQAVDVSGIEEISQITGLINVQRDDEPLLSEELTQRIKTGAPETKDGYYKVKAIL